MRFLKKWYFKIYHLLKLIGIFLIFFIGIVPRVYAEEIDCNSYIYKNQVTLTDISGTIWGQGWYKIDTTNNVKIAPPQNFNKNSTFPIKMYYLFDEVENLNNEVQFQWYYYNTTQTRYITYTVESDNQGIIATITGSTGTSDVNGYYMGVTETNKNKIDGKKMYIFSNETTYNYCKNIIYPTPEPPTPSNDIVGEFVGVYTNRLEYLGTQAEENQYIFAFIVIILMFITLEIFLRIFHIRGGYRK